MTGKLLKKDQELLRNFLREHRSVALQEVHYGDMRWIRFGGNHSIGHTKGFWSNHLKDPKYIAAKQRFEGRMKHAQTIVAEELAALAAQPEPGQGE